MKCRFKYIFKYICVCVCICILYISEFPGSLVVKDLALSLLWLGSLLWHGFNPCIPHVQLKKNMCMCVYVYYINVICMYVYI